MDNHLPDEYDQAVATTEHELRDQQERARRIDSLFLKQKKWMITRKSIVKPKEPIAMLRRAWGDVEFYENVKGDTFVVPPVVVGGGGLVEFGPTVTEQQLPRRVYLSNSDLLTFNWGPYKVKGYWLHENDAVPIGGDLNVWSERLQYTIDAILLNFDKYKKQHSGGMEWIAKLVLYGGGMFVLYWIARWIFFNDPTPPTEAAPVSELAEAAAGAPGIQTVS